MVPNNAEKPSAAVIIQSAGVIPRKLWYVEQVTGRTSIWMSPQQSPPQEVMQFDPRRTRQSTPVRKDGEVLREATSPHCIPATSLGPGEIVQYSGIVHRIDSVRSKRQDGEQSLCSMRVHRWSRKRCHKIASMKTWRRRDLHTAPHVEMRCLWYKPQDPKMQSRNKQSYT